VILGFHHEVDEICALLRYYAVYDGNYTDVLGQPTGPIFKGQTSTRH